MVGDLWKRSSEGYESRRDDTQAPIVIAVGCDRCR